MPPYLVATAQRLPLQPTGASGSGTLVLLAFHSRAYAGGVCERRVGLRVSARDRLPHRLTMLSCDLPFATGPTSRPLDYGLKPHWRRWTRYSSSSAPRPAASCARFRSPPKLTSRRIDPRSVSATSQDCVRMPGRTVAAPRTKSQSRDQCVSAAARFARQRSCGCDRRVEEDGGVCRRVCVQPTSRAWTLAAHRLA